MSAAKWCTDTYIRAYTHQCIYTPILFPNAHPHYFVLLFWFDRNLQGDELQQWLVPYVGEEIAEKIVGEGLTCDDIADFDKDDCDYFGIEEDAIPDLKDAIEDAVAQFAKSLKDATEEKVEFFRLVPVFEW